MSLSSRWIAQLLSSTSSVRSRDEFVHTTGTALRKLHLHRVAAGDRRIVTELAAIVRTPAPGAAVSEDARMVVSAGYRLNTTAEARHLSHLVSHIDRLETQQSTPAPGGTVDYGTVVRNGSDARRNAWN